MTSKRTIKLYATQPPQKYFLILQFGILFATLIFLFSIILHDVGSLMEPLAANTASGDALILFDKLVYSLFVKIAFLFIAVFLLSALLGLFFLERLTGPLVRVQKVLEEIGKGRIPKADIQLRQADFPKKLAKALSEAVTYFKKK